MHPCYSLNCEEGFIEATLSERQVSLSLENTHKRPRTHAHTHTLHCCSLFSYTYCVPLGVAVCSSQLHRHRPPAAEGADGILFNPLVAESDKTHVQRLSTPPFPFTLQHSTPLYIFKTNPPLNILTHVMYRARSRNHQRASHALGRTLELILLALYINLEVIYTHCCVQTGLQM